MIGRVFTGAFDAGEVGSREVSRSPDDLGHDGSQYVQYFFRPDARGRGERGGEGEKGGEIKVREGGREWAAVSGHPVSR